MVAADLLTTLQQGLIATGLAGDRVFVSKDALRRCAQFPAIYLKRGGVSPQPGAPVGIVYNQLSLTVTVLQVGAVRETAADALADAVHAALLVLAPSIQGAGYGWPDFPEHPRLGGVELHYQLPYRRQEREL